MNPRFAGNATCALVPRSRATFLLSAACAMLLPLPAPAQNAGATGTITGRVFNPATGEYVRHAQVRLEGRPQTAASEDGGYYRLSGVAPGQVTLVIAYTGYRPATATLSVAPGATVTRDFELASSLDARPASDAHAPITLGVFTVSGEREGNAKAIMRQRNSMDITNSVASDVFGDVAEGNIGEFLKHMPGVELDLQQGEVRNISLRGLESQYTQVTMDGIVLASADALNPGTGANARSFSFEQVSLSSMDAIEVSKTIGADVDANAPAGTINLKSKRAFNSAGRRVTAQANLTAFSARFNLDNSYGPDDRQSRKIHPGGIFEYSDVFLDKRLGVILNLSESMAYSANARTTVAYNYATTPADPRPVVPTQITFLHAPRTNRRSAVTFSADYKATPRLVLSLTLVYNYSGLNNPQRTLTFNTGARNTVLGADPLTSFTTSAPNASVVSNPLGNGKRGQTISAVPRFEYKIGSFTLEGKFSGSNAISWYDPRGRLGEIRDAGGPTLAGPAFSAQRSSLRGADWKIVQTGGPDMASGANYTNPAITVDDGPSNVTDLLSGEIIGTLRTAKFLPIVWKAGFKKKFEGREFWRDTESLRYNYTGPGAAPIGTWAGYNSPFPYDIGATNTGASLRSVSGGTVFVPDLVRLGTLFREHPEQFTSAVNATNYFNAFIASRRKFQEEIDAAYLMATASIGRLNLRAGLRREETNTDAEDFDPRLPAELAAAGFPETNGRATTIPGLEYQFFSKPKIHGKGNYHNLFPSASLKYRFTQNFDFQFGFSSTIRRATFGQLSGVALINDEALTVSLPNPGLTPEKSKNFSARLAYYFEPVGLFAVNAFQNNVRGLFITSRLTAQEFGYTGVDLASYEFITTTQSDNEITLRGMEYEYSQSLSFLPQPFKGLNVRASYTHNYADIPRANLIPHSINAGLSYGYRRLNAYANLNWRDNYPLGTDGTRFARHRANLDIGGGFRLTSRLNFFFSARNLFNEPFVQLQRIGANPALATFYEVTGINWTFGLKSVW